MPVFGHRALVTDRHHVANSATIGPASDQFCRRARDVCEMNMYHQLRSLCHTSILREAWKDGRPLSVHGWIYSIEDGLLHDLGTCVDAVEDLATLDRWYSG